MYKNKPGVWDKVTDFFILWFMRLVGCVLIIYYAVTPAGGLKSFFKKKESTKSLLEKCIYCNSEPEEEKLSTGGLVKYRLICKCKRTKSHETKDQLIARWNSVICKSPPKKKSKTQESIPKIFSTGF